MAAAAVSARQIGVAGHLRFILRVLAIAAVLAFCAPLAALWRRLGLHNPWSRLFLSGLCRFGGIRLRIEGALPPRGALLLANHVSWIDIPALGAVSGTAFVGHDGLSSTPLLRHLCELNDTVFVARHDRASVHAQVEQVRTALGETGALAIFLEGTTSDGTGLLPFKSSLLSAVDPLPAGITVIPLLLDYGAEAADIAWIGEEHGVDNFRRILARARPLTVTLRFLPALTGEALASRKTIAAAARAAILSALTHSG